MKRIIISLEGIDGAGKSTIVSKINERLKLENCTYSRTKKGIITKKLLSWRIVRKFTWLQIPIYTILSHVNYYLFLKNSSSAPIIIMDRCFLSNLCYFFPLTLKNSFLLKIAMFFEPPIMPHMIFILDVNPLVAQERDNFQKPLDWLISTEAHYIEAYESSLLKNYQMTLIEDLYTIDEKVEIIINEINHYQERIEYEKKINK